MYLCKFTPTTREATTTSGGGSGSRRLEVVLYKIGRSIRASARRDSLARHYRGRYDVQLLDVYRGAGCVERHVHQHFANALAFVEDRTAIRHREFFDFGTYGDEDPADVSARVEEVVESMVAINGGRRARRRRVMASHNGNHYEDDVDVDVFV
jgi:hypothetical protein